MPRKGASYYLPSTGTDEQALEQGMAWLVVEAKKSGKPGLIAVPTNQVAENIASWSQPHKALMAELVQSRSAEIDGIPVQFFTTRSKDVHSWDGPVLVIYADQKLLNAIDDLHGYASVLGIQWHEGELQNWIKTWNASSINAPHGEPNHEAESVAAEAIAALEHLTKAVNPSSGIGHSRDRSTAIRVFETLFHKGSLPAPERIRQQLIRMGWQTSFAEDARELAAQIADGRRPKGSTGHADDNLWDEFVAEAGGEKER